MNDPKKPDAAQDPVFDSTNCDVIEIREEDTRPGKMSVRYRKLLEEKYGKKTPPPNGPAQNGPAQNGPAQNRPAQES